MVATLRVTRADVSRKGRAFIGVCLSIYPHDISKTDAATESPNLTYKCFTMSSKTHLF